MWNADVSLEIKSDPFQDSFGWAKRLFTTERKLKKHDWILMYLILCLDF